MQSGASWPRAELEEAGYAIDSNECKRCEGGNIEDAMHRCWTCPANDDIPACVRTQSMARRAKLDHEALPCVWLRGVLPASWARVPEPPEEEDITDTGEVHLHRIHWQSIVIGAGDASGGQCSADARFRRIGWGTCILDVSQGVSDGHLETWRTVASQAGNLGGRRQTVNRGETRAFLAFLQLTRGAEFALYICDSEVVRRGHARLLQGHWPKSNVDLWRDVDQELKGRAVAIAKVESHLTFEEAGHKGVPFLHVYGNAMADVLAGAAAEQAALPPGVAEGVTWGESIVSSIRSRLAAVFLDVAQKDPRAKPPTDKERKVAVSKMKRMAHKSEHTIRFESRHLSCSTCRSRVSKRLAAQFLESPCIPGTNCADTVVDSRLARGTRTVHDSHLLYYRDDLQVHWCGLCGSYSLERLLALAEPCSRRMSRGCRDTVSRIRRGLLPGSSRAAVAFNSSKPQYSGRSSRASTL